MTKNDTIGDVKLDLEEPINDTCITNRTTSISRKYYEKHLSKFASWKDLKPKFEDDYKFWVDLRDGRDQFVGKVLIQVDIVTKDEQQQCPLGFGRNQPN